MFFVAGITGKVGGAAARELLRQGRAVRALVRDSQKAASWLEKGVDVRQGDLSDAGAVAGALQGVDGAFFMVPPALSPKPGFPEARAVIDSFREALRQAPPPRLVALSSIGSEKASGLGLITSTHMMEKALQELPFPSVFVRAGSFLDNYAFGLQAAAESGVYPSFLQPTDRAVPMVASDDIGREIARWLTATWRGRKIVELGSPVTPNELAQAIGEVLNKPVKAQAIPRDRWSATFEGFGMPRGSTDAYEEMLDGFNSGWIDFGIAGAEPVEATITPRQFFEQAKNS